MASLGSGAVLGLNNAVNTSKSYLYLKLTDSAFKCIEDYLKIRKNCENQPSIYFKENEGVIQIPGRYDGVAFKFQMQSIQECEGPQGSFECISQSGINSLESLGPMFSKLRIQAKEDSYDMTRKRITSAKAQYEKSSIKEFKPKGVINRHWPLKKPLNVQPSKKEPSPIIPQNKSTGNSFNSNSSPNSITPLGNRNLALANSIGKPPLVKSDIIKRPIKERIIQLLAVKSLKRLEVINVLTKQGIREADRRMMNDALNSVSQVHSNVHSLLRHLWSEAKEDWPFYTEEEREIMKRNKSQNLTSSVESISSHSSMVSAHNTCAKRGYDQNILLDPTVKKSRGLSSNYMSEGYLKPSSLSPSVDDGNYMPTDVNSRGTDALSRINNDRNINGHPSPMNNNFVSPLRNDNSPNPSSITYKADIVVGAVNSVSVPSKAVDNILHSNSTRRNCHSESLDQPSNGNAHNFAKMNGHSKTNSPTEMSPSALKALESDFDYMRKLYNDQYIPLHCELKKISDHIYHLKDEAFKQGKGSERYKALRGDIINLYAEIRRCWQETKEKYERLGCILSHIKAKIIEFHDRN